MSMRKSVLQLPLESLSTTKERIPEFLLPIKEFLHNNIQSEGIFRVNGDKLKVLGLNEILSVHDPQIPNETSPHDIASFLKSWLYELPCPLIPPSLVCQYWGSDKVKSTKEVILRLPLVSRKSLAIIFSIIRDVVENENANKMSMGNLIVCVVPPLTHNYNNLPSDFSFKIFYSTAIEMLNETGDDFILTEINSNINLVTPKRRMSSSVLGRSRGKWKVTQMEEDQVLTNFYSSP